MGKGIARRKLVVKYRFPLYVIYSPDRVNAMVEISVENLKKHYGTLVALDNVSLKIGSGEVFGLLGPNGAGKSTLLKILVGILRPTSGTIRIGEHDIVADPEKAKRLIGYLPENPSLYTGLTTLEFLQFVGKIRGVADELLDRKYPILSRASDWRRNVTVWLVACRRV